MQTISTALDLILPTENKAHDAIVALVPADLLWAAAQFASDDPCKELLSTVCLRSKAEGLQITATDGRRLFDVVVPETEHFFCYREEINNERGFKLLAKPLKKRVGYAHYALIRKSGTVEFIGGKKAKKAETLPTDNLCSINADCHPWQSSSFPQTDQLWPTSFGQGTDRAQTFNSQYLASFCNVVTKLSPNGLVKIERNHSTTPVVFSCSYDVFSVEESVQLRCLIMPVQVRD